MAAMKITGFLAFLAATAGASLATAEVDWKDIPASRDLVYHGCHDGQFQCARLILPLDWLDNSDNRTVTIPMIKLPAVVEPDDPAFGGSIITNPGGPGESGVEFIPDFGRQIRNIVDKPGKRHYEIVSFDPRGIGNSEPQANCFPTNALGRAAAVYEARGNSATVNGLDAISYGLAMQEAYANQCEAAGSLPGRAIFPYMSTASVARDVIEMVDKIDELRKREMAAVSDDEFTEDDLRSELKKRSEKDVARLQYFGFSYGTVLGNVLASMYPERIGRIILDGVANAEDFVSEPGYIVNTLDTDKVVDKFLEGCFDAGPVKCALSKSTYTSTSNVTSRVFHWLDNLGKSPKAASDDSGTPVVITKGDVGRVIAYSIYKPIDGFKELASVLDSAMSSNYTQLISKMKEFNMIPSLQAACPSKGEPGQAPQSLDGRAGVVCGDGADVTEKSEGWWQQYFEKQGRTSSILGPYWSTIRFTCARWPFKTNWPVKGPFTTPKHDPDMVKGRPAAPILFLSNRLDPVTPLAGARAMSKNHPGSTVIIQEALGHCTIVTAESDCMKNYVAEYMDTGAVPSGEVTCDDVKCGPWDDGCTVGEMEHAQARGLSLLGISQGKLMSYLWCIAQRAPQQLNSQLHVTRQGSANLNTFELPWRVPSHFGYTSLAYETKMTLAREDALAYLAAKIPPPSPTGDCTLVAIDGRDGSGKTMFANELAAKCRNIHSARNVIRISIDDFHNTRAIRYRRGPRSPEGFWLDSYDYDRFRSCILRPLGPNGSRKYQERSHDLESDAILPHEPNLEAPPSSIVIIDGIFLHRQELADAWDMSIFLEVSAEICAQRMSVRDGSAPELVPEDRYFGGQKMYLESCRPDSKATFVVDNSKLDELTIKACTD